AVLRHRSIADALDPIRIELGPAQILLQHEPRGWHLAHRRQPQLSQILELEIGVCGSADQEKRIAGHDLAKAYEVAIGILLVGLEDALRPTPGHFDAAVGKTSRRPGARPLPHQAYRHAPPTGTSPCDGHV